MVFCLALESVNHLWEFLKMAVIGKQQENVEEDTSDKICLPRK
jgi:hypothetical protein